MPVIKTTITSTKFLAELTRRAAALRSSSIAAKIVVPDSLRWWAFLEYGTALRGEPGFASGHTYDIDPVKRLVLAWPKAGGMHFAAHVVAPGIRPRAFIRKVLPDIRTTAGTAVGSALLASGFDLAAAQSALTQSMSVAIEVMADSLALETTSDVREASTGGIGRTASEALRADAQVVPE
jgi:hypothetical protein